MARSEAARSVGTTRRLLRLLGRVVVVVSLAAAVLTVAGLALVQARGEQVMIVISGSMAPEFAAGDAVLVREVGESELRPGVVIAFHAPGEPEHLTTHRIVSRHPRPEGLFLQTRGDANSAPDPDFVAAGSVVGSMTHSVPALGRWLAFFQTPEGRLLVLGLPLVLLGVGQLASTWRDLRRRGGPTARGPASPRTTLAATSVVLVASVGVGTVLAHSTHALFTDAHPDTGNAFTSSSYCGTGTTYQQAVIADSPLIYHRFSEATGTGSRAVGLNGSTGHVVNTRATAVAGDDSFTIEAWFRTTTGGGKLVGFGNSRTGTSTSYDRHLYLTNSGQVVFGVFASAVREVVSPSTYRDGRWHHVAASLGGTGSGMRLYVDGTLVANLTSTTTAQPYSGYWRIGYDNLAVSGSPPANYYFTGDLDEVAIYTNTLSAARISAHYAERLG